MNKRKPIQQQHERAVIHDFLAWLNKRYGARYVVDSIPDPPEAIIRSGRKFRWVEVADVFYSDEWARDVVSYATPGESHYNTSGRVKVNVDDRLASRFIRVLKSKLTKKTYERFRDDIGPGYLVLVLHHPWLDNRCFHLMKQACVKESWEGDLGCFSSVYVSYRLTQDPEYKRWTYA
jgi:hypothetical protein